MPGEITWLYEHDGTEARTYVDVPDWIEQDIDAATIAAILEGGCDSGAYMPAVTYHQALSTMHEHGDEVLDYIEEVLGGAPAPAMGTSWMGMAVHYLSIAVELWAQGISEELIDEIEDEQADDPAEPDHEER